MIKIDWDETITLSLQLIIVLIISCSFVYILFMSLPIHDCGYQLIDNTCTGWKLLFR
jgi:hypothetical protein